MPFFFRDEVSFTSSEGTVRFNIGGDTGDLTAQEAYLDVMDGWTATAKPVAVYNQRVVGDGATIKSRFYHQGRLLMIEGVIGTENEAETEEAWYDLTSIALPVNEDIIITHWGPTPKFMIARVIDSVRPIQFMPHGFRFATELICGNPFKYDASTTLTGTSGIVGLSSGGMTFPATFDIVFNTSSSGEGNLVTLDNIGDADSYPVIQITGPVLQGWRIENSTTGKYLSFDTEIPAASTLTINSQTKTATLDGSPVTGLIEGEWWSLQKGVNTIRLYAEYNSAASFTITARSAWR